MAFYSRWMLAKVKPSLSRGSSPFIHSQLKLWMDKLCSAIMLSTLSPPLIQIPAAHVWINALMQRYHRYFLFFLLWLLRKRFHVFNVLHSVWCLWSTLLVRIKVFYITSWQTVEMTPPDSCATWPAVLKVAFSWIAQYSDMKRILRSKPCPAALTSSYIVSLVQFAALAEFAATLPFAKYLTCKVAAFS